jgi:hypothetical protein
LRIKRADACTCMFPIVELSDNKLNFSNSIYHNCEISEIKMRYICNIGIIDDIKETHELCSWLSKLIGNYFSILVNYYNLMRTDTFNSFKNNGIRDYFKIDIYLSNIKM